MSGGGQKVQISSSKISPGKSEQKLLYLIKTYMPFDFYSLLYAAEDKFIDHKTYTSSFLLYLGVQS